MSDDTEARRQRFAEKKQRRIERARELAAKHEAAADSRYASYRGITDRIPLGQPIIVGHHSERGHRADIKRMDNHIRAMSRHLDAAKHFKARAETAKSSHIIQADDPDAIDKINERIKDLEHTRDEMKRINKEFKRTGSIDTITMDDNLRRIATQYMSSSYRPDSNPFPSYQITSYTTRIREAKRRAERLTQAADFEGWSHQGFECSQEDGYIVLRCPYKPNEETRRRLKRHPFSLKWSGRLKAWVRKNTGLGDWFSSELRRTIETAMPEGYGVGESND